MSADTVIEDLQADIAARLRADEVLRDIVVVTERSGDPLEEAAVALGLVEGSPHARGVCIVVLQMAANPDGVELPGPVLILQPRIRVLEAPVLNTTGRTALQFARRILRVLHHYQPGIASCLVADSPAILPARDELAPLAYDVALRCMEATSEQVLKTETPTIWPPDGTATSAAPLQISLACDTPDAEILFTVDGSPPYRGNPAAARYVAPFPVDGETLVRAAAWRTGYIGSDVATALFTDPSA